MIRYIQYVNSENSPDVLKAKTKLRNIKFSTLAQVQTKFKR